MRQTRQTPFRAPVLPVPVYNASGQDIPPYAAMLIVDVDSSGRAMVQQPTFNCLTSLILFNGAGAIRKNRAGYGTGALPGFPARVAWGSLFGQPVNRSALGTVTGSWLLWTSAAGFVCAGGGGRGRTSVVLDTGMDQGVSLNSGTPVGVLSSSSSGSSGSSGGAALYDATVVHPSGTLGWMPDNRCWLLNLNTLNPTLGPGELYGAYLIAGSYAVGTDVRPLYRFKGARVVIDVECINGRIVVTKIDF